MTSTRERWNAARGRWRIRAIRGGKWFRERGQKGISMLPHLFTLLNLACGIYSILMTIRGQYQTAALLVGGSLLADGLDGRVARLIRADGEFGRELDSLADVVSFGAAPAILAYQAALDPLGTYGLAVAALFPICGALRLARFNIVKTSGFFIGLPITAAGTLLAGLIYTTAARAVPAAAVAATALVLAYLMVCTIPYPDFKKLHGARFRLRDYAGPLALVLALLVTSPHTAPILPLAAYACLGPWQYLVRRTLDRGAQPREAGPR